LNAFTNGKHHTDTSFIDRAENFDINVNTEVQTSFSQEDIDRLFGN